MANGAAVAFPVYSLWKCFFCCFANGGDGNVGVGEGGSAGRAGSPSPVWPLVSFPDCREGTGGAAQKFKVSFRQLKEQGLELHAAIGLQ